MAIKEKEREQAAAAAERLDARLLAAKVQTAIKLAPTKESLEEAQEAKAAAAAIVARRTLFAKLNAADARRGALLLARARGTTASQRKATRAAPRRSPRCAPPPPRTTSALPPSRAA